MSTAPIPVILLTGFLGSGKSTLLGSILHDPRFSDTAVVVNEFGEVGLDGFLVEHSLEQTVEMTSGCLCCTIRGDVRQTLLSLHRRQAQGEIPAFGRLIIETTGLADPAPVLHTLMTDPRLANRYMLGGVITAVDITTADITLERYAESVKQVAVADRIVLTKTDMALDPASKSDLATLRADLKRMNPGARIVDRYAAGFDIRQLFDTSLYDPLTKSIDVQRWLNSEAYDDNDNAHPHDNSHHHHHEADHRHDINRHGQDIEAFSLILDDPISSTAFTFALELLISSKGADLLRVKGILNIREKPETPVVIHGVQHIFHDPVWLDTWPDTDRRSKIVFITRGVSKATIETLFDAIRTITCDREDIKPEPTS